MVTNGVDLDDRSSMHLELRYKEKGKSYHGSLK